MGSSLTTLKTYVTEPLGLEEEVGEGEFIESAELTSYINDGIRRAARIIRNLYEDYFLTSASLALVTSTSDYTLPTGISVHKIRSIIYDNGTETYPIRRLLRSSRFVDIPDIDTSEDYRYMLVNVSGVVKIRLYPTSRETSSSNVTIWYLRDASSLSSGDDTCDLPDFEDYIVEYAKGQCMAKENGGVVPATQQNRIDTLEQEMRESLSDRVPDTDDYVEQDCTHYNEHS